MSKPLQERVAEDLVRSMKQRDGNRTDCLRMLKTAFKRVQVDRGRDLKDDEAQAVVASQIRKGREAAEEFRKGGREDLASKEEREIAILSEYLPEPLSPEAIEASVREVIRDLKAAGPKDMGKVMKAASVRMAGQAQGKDISDTAKRLLSQIVPESP